MNGINIYQHLRTSLINYLITTFDVNKDGLEPELASRLRESFEQSEALFNGPFLEFTLPYKTDFSLLDFIDKGLLTRKLIDLSCFNLEKPEPIALDTLLYTHQSKAIQELCEERRSIVISSGTGSGKTECFTIPIIDDLLRDSTPGVRALLIYPLNALVNDQLDRLRTLLKGTDITFGRYTSELPNEVKRDGSYLPNEIISRYEIREEKRIPQILITNYAMLEYLLVRPEDSVLFNSGEWKYLVLDEAHTYTGAQGIEVSMLLRRLKQRLSKQKGDMLCVATSATLTNEDPETAADFAARLFGEDIKNDAVIFGEPSNDILLIEDNLGRFISPQVYLNEKIHYLIDELKNESLDVDKIALWMYEIKLINENELALAEKYTDDQMGYLFQIFQRNRDLYKLQKILVRYQGPVKLPQIAKDMFPDLDKDDQLIATTVLIELGALAKPSIDSLPIIPGKYHIFARPPQGVWVCINPDCPGRNSENTFWSQIYSDPHEKCEYCGCTVFPIHICRECGQVFIATYFDGKIYTPSSGFLMEGLEKRYFTWRSIKENLALGNAGDELEDEDGEEFYYTSEFQQTEFILCLNCGREISKCDCNKPIPTITLFDILKKDVKKKKGQIYKQWHPIQDLNECPRCKNRSKKDTEIATAITLRGMAPLANLTYELFRKLPESKEASKKKIPGRGRKLLTFYDSRQGAARFAAYLQDVVNRQNYRHLIPEAICKCQNPDEWGEGSWPGLIQLCKEFVDLAWEKYFTIQNDPDSNRWRDYLSKMGSSERNQELKRIAALIMGEFTTGMRSRQSLESMGLVGIQYFDKNDELDFQELSEKISLSPTQTQTLINYLLDKLRYRKAITLPDGVNADDPAFGFHKGHPTIIRQGKVNSWQIRFIGETDRHRIRKYMKWVLHENKLTDSESDVISTLNHIWFWLVEKTKILKGSANEGYRIDRSRLLFTTEVNWFRCKNCQRLSYRGLSLPCPFPYCGGELEKIDIESIQESNYFYHLFKRELVSIRVEEHTAQLDSEKGQQYQKLFYDGKINALSCSTTFELGIDVGDLNAVAMNNVPPSIANYRQRSGRAGRRKGGTAVILTWASNRPHDQVFYRNPNEIISGNIMAPFFTLANEKIIHRHINAILLSRFLRFRWKNGVPLENLRYCKDFFDYDYTENPHIHYLDTWIDCEEESINEMLMNFSSRFEESVNNVIKDSVQQFKNDLKRVNEEHYQKVTEYYLERIEILADKITETNLSNKKSHEIITELGYYRRLLNRVRGYQNDGFLINYLSSNGVLPSYSFPLHTIELVLPKEAREQNLRLQRDLRQAIREYAPGNEIVADKRIWKSEKPIFWNKTPKILGYRICNNCHHLEISEAPGLPLNDIYICPICGNIYSNRELHKKFVEPDGFLAEKGKGKPARQYVRSEPNRMRSGLIPQAMLENEIHQEIIDLAYDKKGRLLYVNEGVFGKGFKFSVDGDNKIGMSYGFIQETDTLHIGFEPKQYFSIPSPENHSLWSSLMYAIIHGACHVLQIERTDIDGVLFPIKKEDTWQQKIVLFDNVPGGAGHVKNIKENFQKVLEGAFQVLNCQDCTEDTSCYHCLKDYNNQYFHEELERGPALKFMTRVLSYIEPLEECAVKISLPNNQYWIYRKIKFAENSVDIAVNQITAQHPIGSQYTWLDTIQDLVNKNIKVNLYLKSTEGDEPENLSLRNHIKLLIDKGMGIWKINQIPKWQILIDKDTSEPYAISSSTYPEKPIKLNADFSGDSLHATQNKASINIILNEWSKVIRNRLTQNDFKIPPNTQVRNIHTTSQLGFTEEKLFKEFFEKPVTKMIINDPYLNDKERIVNRAGSYIKLAYKSGHLEDVVIQTKKARPDFEQVEAENELMRKYPNLIRFKHFAEHDRWIEVTRIDNEKARVIIGRGLDFIQPDGSLKRTYVVIQDPYE